MEREQICTWKEIIDLTDVYNQKVGQTRGKNGEKYTQFDNLDLIVKIDIFHRKRILTFDDFLTFDDLFDGNQDILKSENLSKMMKICKLCWPETDSTPPPVHDLRVMSPGPIFHPTTYDVPIAHVHANLLSMMCPCIVWTWAGACTL